MGCGTSNNAEGNDRSLRNYQRDFGIIGLTEYDIAKLKNVFTAIDLDNSDEIAIVELFAVVKVEMSSFNQRVFKMFDSDHSACINFREFTIALWNYCTLSKNTFVDFIFSIYDSDGSGRLSIDECIEIVRDVYGEQYETSIQAKKLSAKLQSNKNKTVCVEEFHELVKKHSAMLYPAYCLRGTLREMVVGDGFWAKHETNRRVAYNDTYWPPTTIIKHRGDVQSMQSEKDAQRSHELHQDKVSSEAAKPSVRKVKGQDLPTKAEYKKARKRSILAMIIRNTSKDLGDLVDKLTTRKIKHDDQARRVSIFTHFYDGLVKVDPKKAKVKTTKVKPRRIQVSSVKFKPLGSEPANYMTSCAH